MEKYENLNLADDIFTHERQDEGEPTPEELQERADEKRKEMAEDKAKEVNETGYDRLKAECERDAKFAIAQHKMMQPLYDLLIPKI